MPSEAKHSALPWRADGRRIYDANDYHVAVVDGQALIGGEHAELAAFIVRACNAVEGLWDAAQAVSLSTQIATKNLLGVPLDEVVVIDRAKMMALQRCLAAAKGDA